MYTERQNNIEINVGTNPNPLNIFQPQLMHVDYRGGVGSSLVINASRKKGWADFFEALRVLILNADRLGVDLQVSNRFPIAFLMKELNVSVNIPALVLPSGWLSYRYLFSGAPYTAKNDCVNLINFIFSLALGKIFYYLALR